MGMFDIQFSKRIQLNYGNIHLFEFFKRQLQKNRTYQSKIEETTLTIEKYHINPLLKYKLNIHLQKNKKDNNSEITITGELQYTFLLTILILLSILLTYGLGIIFVIGFMYYQKVVVTKQLQTLLHNYKSTIK